MLGLGPNRIGQGIEFDYCCVHASFSLREIGCETEMKATGEVMGISSDVGKVRLVVNTPRGDRARSDGQTIRKAARRNGVPCVTTIQGALAVARGLRAGPGATLKTRSLQEWRATV